MLQSRGFNNDDLKLQRQPIEFETPPLRDPATARGPIAVGPTRGRVLLLFSLPADCSLSLDNLSSNKLIITKEIRNDFGVVGSVAKIFKVRYSAESAAAAVGSSSSSS